MFLNLRGGSCPYPLNLLKERKAIVVTQSLICLHEAAWAGVRGWGEERDKDQEKLHSRAQPLHVASPGSTSRPELGVAPEYSRVWLWNHKKVRDGGISH